MANEITDLTTSGPGHDKIDVRLGSVIGRIKTHNSYFKSENDCFEIVTDIQALLALRSDWENLCRRSSQHRFSQSFVWCWTTWEVVEGPRGRRLHCIVTRNRGRAVLIWPFIVYRKSFLRVASPLGCSYAEYPDPLVEDGPEADRRIKTAWQILGQTCGCDIIKLSFVREGSELHRLLGDLGKKVKIVSSVTNLYVSWHNYENWQSYYGSRPSKDRRDNERRRRRLDERGSVTFEVIDGARCGPVIDWALPAKVKQLARTDRSGGSWLKTKAYRNLLVCAASRSSPEGRLVMFVLKLDNQIIATLLCRIDHVRIEALNTVFDADFSRYAPGKILYGAVLEWAFGRRLDFDMRGGDEPYKRRWANRESAVFSYEVVNSALSALYLRSLIVRPFVRKLRKFYRRFCSRAKQQCAIFYSQTRR